MRSNTFRFSLCLALGATAACSFGGDKSSTGDIKVAFGGDSASRLPAMGEGDVRITSTDNVLVLSVIGDTLRLQLSDSLRGSVAHSVDSSMGDKGGIGAAIAKSVSSVVSGAMGFVVRVHVNDVENLRYENGHLRFDTKGGHTQINSSDHSRDKATFSLEDAQRFIEAVRRKQGKQPVQL